MIEGHRLKPLVVLGYPKIDHEKDYVYYWMPFSILTLANVLLKSAIADVILFDGNQHDSSEWEDVLRNNIDRTICIGLSIMTGGGQISHALHMAGRARKISSAPIIFGGPHVNVLPRQTLEHDLVDVVLTGPGQTSIVPYVEALLGVRTYEAVPGLLMKTPKGILVGSENPARIQDLGGYPWQLLDVERYIRSDPTVSDRTLNYVASQGCVYKCQFCYELTYKRKYSKIPSDYLLDEMQSLSANFGATGIKFYDADWFIDLKRADAFSRGLLERKLNINWAASINPNDVLRARKLLPHLMRQVAESGCTRLLMGVESGSDRVLREIVRKEVSSSEIFDVASEIADVGIIGSYTFIVGFPGETYDEQMETFRLIERLWSLSPVPESRVHLFAPYPGTPLFQAAIDAGFEMPTRLEDWASYDYYEAQTPWATRSLAEKARNFTRMRLTPKSRREIRDDQSSGVVGPAS